MLHTIKPSLKGSDHDPVAEAAAKIAIRTQALDHDASGKFRISEQLAIQCIEGLVDRLVKGDELVESDDLE